MKLPAPGVTRKKTLKAGLVCLLVLGITSLMYYAVTSRYPLDEDRARRAEKFRQSVIADEQAKADHARRKDEGRTAGLDSLIDAFSGNGMASERQQIISLKSELEHMDGGDTGWEAKKRRLEALEKEVNDYDQAMEKLRSR